MINQSFFGLLEKTNLPSPLAQRDIPIPINNIDDKIETEFGTDEKIIITWKLFPFEIEKKNDAILLLGKDVTKLRKAEEKVFELDSVIAQAPGNLYWFSKDLTYLGCNENSAHTLSMERSETIGQDFKTLMQRVKAKDKALLIDTFVAQANEVIRTGKPLLGIEEPPFYGPDGKLHYYLANKVPLFDHYGKIYGVIGISTDITWRKQLENELVESRTREESFKAISALGGMIAHELRTPLASLKLLSETITDLLAELIQGYELSSSKGEIADPLSHHQMQHLKQSLVDMKQTVRYAQTTVSAILSGFHYSSPVGGLTETIFQFNEVVKNAVEQYPLRGDQMPLISIRHLDKCLIKGEEQILIHVLNNLLKNALQAIETAGKGKISIWSELNSETIVLFVEDTATGIPANRLPHIFEAFYTTKEKASESVGLGLYFCKMALQKIHGTIECESTVDLYTRFRVILPLYIPSESK